MNRMANELEQLKQEMAEKEERWAHEREAYEDRIATLEARIRVLEEQLKNINDLVFGKKKEKSNHSDDKTESNDNDNLNSSENIQVHSHKRTRRGKRGKATLDFSNLEEETMQHDLPDNQKKCDCCQNELKEVANPIVRKEVVYVPAKLKLVVHRQRVYKCDRNCSEDGGTRLKKAEVPKPLINHSPAGSPSVVAHVATMKYVYKVPLYRQEAMWSLMGLDINRKQMANWMLITFNERLIPLYDRLVEELLKQRYLHIDETPYTTIESDKDKTYYWIMTSGKYEKHPIAIFEHQDGRSSAQAHKWLDNFKGYVQSDGYIAYNFVNEDKHLGCLAHARRKFFKAAKNSRQNKAKSFSQGIVDLFDEIFKLDRKSSDLSEIERYKFLQKNAKPKLEEIYLRLATKIDEVASKSALGEAVNYMINQKVYIMNVFSTGYLEMSNNSVERAVKENVMGRKNWLFSYSFDGSQANAVALTFITTAKLNGLNPESYLERIFQTVASKDYLNEEDIQELLPWNIDMARFKDRRLSA